jgi:hypothetical protein
VGPAQPGGAGGAAGLWGSGGAGGQGGAGVLYNAVLSPNQTLPLTMTGGNGGDGGRGGLLYGPGGTPGQGGAGGPAKIFLTVDGTAGTPQAVSILNNTAGSAAVTATVQDGAMSLSTGSLNIAAGATNSLTVALGAGFTTGHLLIGAPAITGNAGHAGNAGASGLL